MSLNNGNCFQIFLYFYQYHLQWQREDWRESKRNKIRREREGERDEEEPMRGREITCTSTEMITREKPKHGWPRPCQLSPIWLKTRFHVHVISLPLIGSSLSLSPFLTHLISSYSFCSPFIPLSAAGDDTNKPIDIFSKKFHPFAISSTVSLIMKANFVSFSTIIFHLGYINQAF